MKTREKIIYTALLLFNESGERNVTTNHIATHLQISPGNLYYHFKNKQEIIRGIFADYSIELLELFSPMETEQESLRQLKHYLDSIFVLMWKYRFFYTNLPQILQQDKVLHKKYLAVQEKSKKNLYTISCAFIKLKLFDIKEEDLKTINTSLHLIITSWLSYQSSISLTSEITEKEIHQGILQMTAVMKLISTDLGKKQLIQIEAEIAKKS